MVLLLTTMVRDRAAGLADLDRGPPDLAMSASPFDSDGVRRRGRRIRSLDGGGVVGHELEATGGEVAREQFFETRLVDQWLSSAKRRYAISATSSPITSVPQICQGGRVARST